jgi:hypothetical protein
MGIHSPEPPLIFPTVVPTQMKYKSTVLATIVFHPLQFREVKMALTETFSCTRLEPRDNEASKDKHKIARSLEPPFLLLEKQDRGAIK